jgi:hypothetical protein
MVGRIQMLERESLRLLDSVIVNLVQVDFAGRIVYIVLVGGVAGPISARRINLDGN